MNRMTTATIAMVLLVTVLTLNRSSVIIANGQGDKANKRASKEEILKYLPEDSKIAAIGILHNLDGSVKEKGREGIIYADMNGDGKEDIVVAYYTPPHEYADDQGKENEGFYERAHVAILHRHGDNKFIKDWDSGGWGYNFNIRHVPAGCEKDPLQIFHVADFNKDNRPDLIFSRSSFSAEGSETEIWSFNGKEYVCQLSAVGKNEFREDEKGERVILNLSYYSANLGGGTYRFNKKTGKYEGTGDSIMITTAEFRADHQKAREKWDNWLETQYKKYKKIDIDKK